MTSTPPHTSRRVRAAARAANRDGAEGAVRGVRPRRRGVRPRPAHGRGDVVFAAAAARGAQDGGPERLDLPAAAAAAGGPTALLGRRPAPKRPASGRASAARRAAPLLPSTSRRGPVWQRRLITPGSVRAPGY